MIAQISKETEDKVKLAKKFIEDKYQNILIKQKQEEESWKKIVSLMTRNNLSQNQKNQIQRQIHSQKQNQKRLMRQKDTLKNYQLFQIIGKGAFGDVRLAKNKLTNEIVAIKRIQKQILVEKRQISSAYLERQLMIKNEDSVFLVKLKSTFQDKNHLYLVMQYIPGGDLLHLLIQKDIFSQEETKFYIAQLIVALQQIHSRNYIHRDIKPDNILINKDGHIKISDFGLSKYVDKSFYEFKNQQMDIKKPVNRKSKLSNQKKIHCLRNLNIIHQKSIRKFSKVGTPDYISPEVLISDQYDFSIDIWSVGVIMFQCLFGYPPFSDQDSKEVCQKVINWAEYLEFPSDIQVSDDAKLLILGMINDRQKRLSIEKIKKHPFFKGINWGQLLSYKPPMIPNLQNQLDIRNFQKYQQDDDWQYQNQDCQEDKICQNQPNFTKKHLFQNIQKCRKRSSSVDFIFAGFQYTKISFEPFRQIQNQIRRYKSTNKIKLDTKQSSIYKPSQLNQKSLKRFKTFEDGNNKVEQKQIITNKISSKYAIKKAFSSKNMPLNINGNKTTYNFSGLCQLTNKNISMESKKLKQITKTKIKKSNHLTPSPFNKPNKMTMLQHINLA